METTANFQDSPRSRRWLILALAVLIAIVIVDSYGYLRSLPFFSQSSGGLPAEIDQTAFEQQTGVRVVQVALSAAGGMIDLRYQVIDPDKAVIVHDLESLPAIRDEASGVLLERQWMDHPHERDMKMGIIYYTLLVNTGGILKPGSRVSVILGGVPLEHVVITSGNGK